MQYIKAQNKAWMQNNICVFVYFFLFFFLLEYVWPQIWLKLCFLKVKGKKNIKDPHLSKPN